ncbi:MAG: MotA/TolQ/ExbB proton channel family protein [Alphaproteobacteria bacterium]|nr:MotA/TolQ/ExbB proton channel family protein [Alphaproteobacteria bacterium]
MAMPREDEPLIAARTRLPSLLRLPGQTDLSVLMGIGGALALLAIAIGASGSIMAFIDVPSMLIVLGGTAAITAAGYAPSDIAHATAAAARTLLRASHSAAEVATDILECAAQARSGGAQALRRVLDARDPDDKLRRSLSLAAVGLPVEGIEAMIDRETRAGIQRLATAAGILRRAADVAPAMGLIGTLIGLVQMLGVLDTPSKIGPGMALALLTTLYGAVLAHLVLLPLAARLDRAAEDDERVAQLCRMGAVSIARQESLNTLEMQLNSALPPADRPRYVD